MATTHTEEDADDDAAALSQLMQALAAGARAVQGIPIEDDFSFQRSFPEFTQALSTAQTSLLQAIGLTLETLPETGTEDTSGGDGTNNFEFMDMEDPILWEQCADACDLLVEQVEGQMQSKGDHGQSGGAAAVANLKNWSDQARQRGKSGFGRMLEGMVEMEKPQLTFDILQQNEREEPFIPAVHPDKPFGVTPLDLTLQPGHALESRFGDLRAVNVSDTIVAPDTHVPHVYETEIKSFAYRDWQLEAVKPPDGLIPIMDPMEATFVDTIEKLQALSKKLETVREVAVDLEAHSYRSFAGMLCLMQVSFRNSENCMENYLIDTLQLHEHITEYLAPFLANPDIVKVMHGADSDVQWLQRDFGCYIVNLFDTGRAARAMQLSSAGYAYLLQTYCQINADKSHQMADWRQRPLPYAMQQYAIQDTHYLLDIYDRLKWDLSTKHKDTSIAKVLDASRQVCLIRYAGEPFKPVGYKMVLNRQRGRKRSELNGRQEHVLQQLWDWRDETARQQDESCVYVCANEALLKLALSCPVTVTALQSLFNPMPPLVMRFSQDVLGIIKRASQSDGDARFDHDDEDDDEDDEEVAARRRPVGAPSSAFFKPASADEDRRRSGMLSPVLGTEALYEQAGWMTPQEQVPTTDEDDADLEDGAKPRRLLSVHESNKEFRSKREPQAGHSLGLGNESGSSGGQVRTADGMGTARAARDSSRSPKPPQSIEDEAKTAQQNSAMIRSGLSQQQTLPAVMGLASHPTTIEMEEDEGGEDGGVDDSKGGPNELEEEEFVMPRSMREIYKISNRNRSHKKAGSPTPERGMTPTTEKEREELARAEVLLTERGIAELGYFDDNPASPGKRQRTKTSTGRESEESVPQDSSSVASKEDDVAFMKEIGWIKNSGEIQTMMGRPAGDDSEEPQPDGTSQMKGINRHAPSGYDYSTVGPIGAMAPGGQATNPFFSGAAVAGGPLAQGFTAKPDNRTKKTNTSNRAKQQNRGKQQQKGQQERPEKTDGRTTAYRKR
jgi:exosome complex exonuclease RRP6